MSVVSSKGKAPTTPTSSQRSKPENEEMPDAPAVNELRETLRVKLPDTYSGNRKDLKVFLLQVELYQYFNDDKFPTTESYALWTTSYLRGEALQWVEPFLKDYFLYENTCGKGESSDEESEAKSLTTSEQETYDELALKESMNLRCEEIVKDMAKFAHAKIKKAREEPDGATLDSERKVSMIKSIYKSSLHKVPQQVLAKDQGDDLLKKQQAEWL
ncbi:hypothetical protein VF21_10657 [Pseudogymnoascus sp. 05NY08]|nr:hypothetical protein VF21_10657 [Pseudogymnoascus sp. 05NY08]